MQEGSLRCDVNLSVRKVGSEKFGTRTEMKNINSFQFVVKAIEYEYKRQVEAIEAGEAIVQETRRFDPDSGKTYSMRTKENANDYRYFPDPDLPPIELTDEEIKNLGSQIPELPDARKAKYINEYGLSAYDGELLTNDKAMADYFEAAAAKTNYPKLLANMMISEMMRLITTESFECGISPENMACLSTLAGDDVINSSTAKKLLVRMWENDFDPAEVVKSEGLEQINDDAILLEYIREAIAANPRSVADNKRGKTVAAKSIVGQAMAKSKGKANPVKLGELAIAEIEKAE